MHTGQVNFRGILPRSASNVTEPLLHPRQDYRLTHHVIETILRDHTVDTKFARQIFIPYGTKKCDNVTAWTGLVTRHVQTEAILNRPSPSLSYICTSNTYEYCA